MFTNGIETEINARKGICIAPGEDFKGEVSEDCEQLIVKINADFLDAHVGQRRARLAPEIDLHQTKLQPWVDFMRSILRSPSTVEIIQRDPSVAESYEQLLLNLLISGQGVLSRPAGSNAVPTSVHAAERFIRSNYAAPLRLEEIARAAQVPQRTLLNHFREFRQTSPMQLLRDVRLDIVREKLLSAPQTNVAAAGMDAGFSHLGRFASDYRDRFGETPSQTKLRARRRPAPAF
ncbi:MAG TPA: AraC family transcriptional regulator [Sphingobium sp.]|nr:AraC family transcriptional regulator [Sphingobium sp.]